MRSKLFLLQLAFLAVLFCGAVVATESASNGDNAKVDDDDFIHLHIIPHTHNDAGWLYTVNSYYRGTNPRGCVECILNNVTKALQVNPDRKFVYVEQVYFQEWWEELPAETRETVLKLIKNGQLEFLLAGYVMNDEACSYYDDIIEQMTLGHRFIKTTFNHTVREAWHIDPFGHSAAQARLFSEMGFNAWFFERIDYQDFDNRLRFRDLETVWRPQSYDPSTNFIFAHVNYMSYYLAPYNWCIDMLCYPEPNLPEVVRKALKYVSWVKNQTNFFRTKHILHHVGGDFEWSGNTPNHYEGLETLIDFINSHPSLGIKAYFSTPRNYSESVYQETLKKNVTFSEKTDDFFPYQDVPHAYWTGYFTSKADMKGMIRAASKYLQGVRKILTQFLIQKNLTYSNFDSGVYELERALSILQHHDAVTGTAKHLVDVNYTEILEVGYNGADNLLLPLLKKSFIQKYQKQVGDFQLCNQPLSRCNITQVLAKAGNSVVAYIYNPSQITTRTISLQVPATPFIIKDETGAVIPHDVFCDESRLPISDKNKAMIRIYTSMLKMQPKLLLKNLKIPKQNVFCEAYFTADLPTNKLKLFTLVPSASRVPPSKSLPNLKTNIKNKKKKDDPTQIIELFNGEKLLIGSDSKSFVYITAESKNPFTLDYRYYVSYYAPNEQVSGAYIFRPAENSSLEYSKIKGISVQRGDQVIEVKIERELVITRLRFYKNQLSQTIEIQSFLLSVPIADGLGKEITLNIENTGIRNRGVFYTDANGLEMQKRVLNYRPTYPVDILEPVAGNYYPINSAIYIEDAENQQRVTLMNDRSQGGSSLKDGAFEVMLHRRILHDDNRGVDEPLNETFPNGEGITVLTKHWLFFSKGPEKQRQLQYDLDTEAMLYLATLSGNSALRPQKPAARRKIGTNEVKLYVRPYDDHQLLVRLHNVREDQSTTVSFWSKEKGVCYSLEELLGDSYDKVKVSHVQEVTLDTVQDKQEMLKNKFSWDHKYQYNQTADTYESVLLRPLEERAFILTI
mgnify:FL=1